MAENESITLHTPNKYYVYCFFNKDWNEVFYIGKGSGCRCNEFNNRSKHILAILKNHKCESKILYDNLDEKTALQIENELKIKYINLGCPIIDYENKSINNQRIGIERAKQEGKYKGRKPIAIDQQKFGEEYQLWSNGVITAELAMEHLGLKPNTFYRNVEKYERDNGLMPFRNRPHKKSSKYKGE